MALKHFCEKTSSFSQKCLSAIHFFSGQKTHDHQIAVTGPVLDVENNTTIFSSRNGTVFEINGTRFPKCYLSTFLRKITIFCILGGSKKGVSGSRRIVLDPKTKVRPKNPKFPKCYLSTFVRKRQIYALYYLPPLLFTDT